MTQTPKMSAEWRKGLILTLFYGAAREDATPEQIEQLREGVVLPIAVYRATGSVRMLVDVVGNVMGEDWEPKGDWKTKIEELLDEGEKDESTR